MKRLKMLSLFFGVFLLVGCSQKIDEIQGDVINIELSDSKIFVENENGVYVENDIIYYEAGKDFTYGEGTDEDSHSKEEALEHKVVHITEAGTYRISGTLSKGQIAVDLGEDAKENPEAVVTLILDGVDITCEVAPAIIFYNVYECGSDDADRATSEVDTSKAGANVVIADDTNNIVDGSYVARIYKPESVVLNADGTEVEDAKKLHKYDGAFYSRMSMNVDGEKNDTGVLNIIADNEGLDSELHLTINGGIINIQSGNDGINTNEDGISVTTINGGELNIQVTGETGEGDGIDSNGWLVINGGKVTAFACSDSEDAGIDSDMGIHINGGTVAATGSMLDRIEDNGQEYLIFQMREKQNKPETFLIKNADKEVVSEIYIENACSVLIYSSPDLKEGVYSLWDSMGNEIAQSSDGMMGGPGGPGMRPEEFEGMEPPEKPEGMEPPALPEGVERKEPPEKPGDMAPMEEKML